MPDAVPEVGEILYQMVPTCSNVTRPEQPAAHKSLLHDGTEANSGAAPPALIIHTSHYQALT